MAHVRICNNNNNGILNQYQPVTVSLPECNHFQFKFSKTVTLKHHVGGGRVQLLIF